MVFLSHFFDAFQYVLSRDYGTWFFVLGSVVGFLYFIFRLLYVAR